MYCTALKNLYFRILCILITIVSLLFISVSSNVQSDSLVKPAGKSRPGCLTDVLKDENNQPLTGATIIIGKERKNVSTSVSGDYVFVLTPGTYTALISAVNFSSQRISDIIIKSNEQTNLL